MPFSKATRKSLFFLATFFSSILCFSLLLTFQVSGSEKSLKNRNQSINYSTRFDSVDREFAKRFAPLLNFHPGEAKLCCFPSSAEAAFPRARSGKTGEMRTPKVLDPQTPCYYEALKTATGFRIKYWFWYNYNDYPTGPDWWGCHPGDWEYVEIYFEKNQPVEYVFSNHNGVRVRRPDEVVLKSEQLQVWVGLGSHANYESETPRHISSVLGFSDKVSSGGQLWNTADSLVDVKNTNFCRENFRGDWGDGKKIFGPVSRTDD